MSSTNHQKNVNKKIYYQFLLSSNNPLESQELENRRSRFASDRDSFSSNLFRQKLSSVRESTSSILFSQSIELSSGKETQKNLLDNKIITLLQNKIKLEENPYNGLKRIASDPLKTPGVKSISPNVKKKLPIFTLSTFFPYRKTFLCYWLLPLVGFVYTASTTAHTPHIKSFLARGGSVESSLSGYGLKSQQTVSIAGFAQRSSKTMSEQNILSRFATSPQAPEAIASGSPSGYGARDPVGTSYSLSNSLLTTEFNVKSNLLNSEIQKYCKYYLSSLNDYVQSKQSNLLNELDEIQFNKRYLPLAKTSKLPFHFQKSRIDYRTTSFRLSRDPLGTKSNLFSLTLLKTELNTTLRNGETFSPGLLEAPPWLLSGAKPHNRPPGTRAWGAENKFHLKVSFLSKMLPSTSVQGVKPTMDIQTLEKTAVEKTNQEIFFNPIISYSQASSLLDAFSQNQFFTKNQSLQHALSNRENHKLHSSREHFNIKNLDFYEKFFSYKNILNEFGKNNLEHLGLKTFDAEGAFGEKESLLGAKLKLDSLSSSLFLNKIQNVSQKVPSLVLPQGEVNKSQSSEISYSKLSKDQLYNLLFNSLQKQIVTPFVPSTPGTLNKTHKLDFVKESLPLREGIVMGVLEEGKKPLLENQRKTIAGDRQLTGAKPSRELTLSILYKPAIENRRSRFSSDEIKFLNDDSPVKNHNLKTLKLAHPFLMSIKEKDSVDTVYSVQSRFSPERNFDLNKSNKIEFLSPPSLKRLDKVDSLTVDVYQTRKSDLKGSDEVKNRLRRFSSDSLAVMANKKAATYSSGQRNDFSNYSHFVKSYYYKLKNYIMYSRLKTNGLRNESKFVLSPAASDGAAAQRASSGFVGFANRIDRRQRGALTDPFTEQTHDSKWTEENRLRRFSSPLITKSYRESTKSILFRDFVPGRGKGSLIENRLRRFSSGTKSPVSDRSDSKLRFDVDPLTDPLLNQDYPWLKIEKVLRAYFSIKNPTHEKSKRPSSLERETRKMSNVSFSGTPRLGNLQTKLTEQNLIVLKNKLKKKIILQNLIFSPLAKREGLKIENSQFPKTKNRSLDSQTLKQTHPVRLIIKNRLAMNLKPHLEGGVPLVQPEVDGSETQILNGYSLISSQGHTSAYSFANKKHVQKKRRIKKLKKETRQRKKRKRFYPRPIWIRYRLYSNYLKNRYYSFNNALTQTQNTVRFRSPQREKETTLTGGNVLFNESKSFYTISRPVLGELKRVLWKSYWLRSNLNPYLNKVKSYLANIKQSKQSWELYTHLNSFFMYFLGFNQDLSSTYQKSPLNTSFYLGPLTDNKLQNSMYVAEYYRNVYERLQQFISQIRENLTLNGNIKVRASQVGHLPFTKGVFGKEKRGIALKKNEDFWVKLGKTLTLETHQSSISPQAPSAKATSKLRLYWAFSKTSYGFHKETHNRKRAWETTKQREQTKNNKTKKLFRNVKNQIKNLLTNSFPFIPEYLVLDKLEASGYSDFVTSFSSQEPTAGRMPKATSSLNKVDDVYSVANALPVSTSTPSSGVQKSKNPLKTIEKHFKKTTLSEKLNSIDKIDSLGMLGEKLENLKTNDSNFNKNINKLLQKALQKARQKDEKASVFQSITRNVNNSVLKRNDEVPIAGFAQRSSKTIVFDDRLIGVSLDKPSIENRRSRFSSGSLTTTTQSGNKKYILQKVLGYRNDPGLLLQNISGQQASILPPNQNSRPVFYRDNIQNHLTTKSAYWWTEKISLDTLVGPSSQSEGIFFTARFAEENNVKMNQSENSIFIISSLLFHFCTLLSILSISHIRGFLKVSLLAISKTYKMSLSLLTPVVSSNVSSFKLKRIDDISSLSLDKVAKPLESSKSIKRIDEVYSLFVSSLPNSKQSVPAPPGFRAGGHKGASHQRNFSILKRVLLNRSLPRLNGAHVEHRLRRSPGEAGNSDKVTPIARDPLGTKSMLFGSKTNSVSEKRNFKKGTSEHSQFEFFKLFTFIYNLNDLVSFVTTNQLANQKSKEKSQLNRVDKVDSLGPPLDNPEEISIVFDDRWAKPAMQASQRGTEGRQGFSLTQKLYLLLRYSIKKPIYYFKIKTRPQLNVRDNNRTISSLPQVSRLPQALPPPSGGGVDRVERRPEKTISLIQYSLTKLSVYSLLTMNTVTKHYYNLYFTTSSVLKEIKVNVFEKCLRAVYTFLEKPGEQIVDWVAYMFLVEWASDISNTIPENLDLYVGSTTSKLTRIFFFYNLNLNGVLSPFGVFVTEFMRRNDSTLSLNLHASLLLNTSLGSSTLPTVSKTQSSLSESNIFTLSLFNFMNPFIQRRMTHLYDILLLQFYQPDTDLITRQKKGILFWDIWGDFLMQTAEESNINISELTSVKEEQIKLLEKCEIGLDNPSVSAPPGSPPGREPRSGAYSGAKIPVKKIDEVSSLGARKMGSVQTFGAKIRNLLNFAVSTSSSSQTGATKGTLSSTGDYFLKSLSQTDLIDPRLGWGAQQYLSYQGKDTELFIDLHPRASLDMVSLLKSNESVQQPIGTLVCQIYSGLLSKQISKNILVVGSSGVEKSLLIQAIAGETELKIITDNAYRYATVYRGVAVGIKLLRDVFDSLVATGPPCLFLIEDIHAIGEKRPLLISDDETVSRRDGASQEIHEKNQVFYQLSKHVMTHYKKPYKGDFSLLIPTNHFCFDFFLVGLNSRMTNLYNPSNGGANQNTKISGNTKKSVLPKMNSTGENNASVNSKLSEVNSQSSKNSLKSLTAYKKVPSRLLIKSSELLSPPANSPFSFLSLVDSKKFKPLKTLSEMPWAGLPGEQLSQVSKASYSIRVKVALLADMAISSLSVKLDMITDLLVIIDSVKGNRGFVVFATTHVPYVLDPALRRPGRLDETISLGLLPSVFARWEILKASFSSLNSNVNPVVPGLSLQTTLDFSYFTKNVSNQYGLTQIQAKLFNYIESRRSRFSSGLDNTTSRVTGAAHRDPEGIDERSISTIFTNQPYMASLLTTFQKSLGNGSSPSTALKRIDKVNSLLPTYRELTEENRRSRFSKSILFRDEVPGRGKGSLIENRLRRFSSGTKSPVSDRSDSKGRFDVDPWTDPVNKLSQTLLSQTYYSASTFLMMTVPRSTLNRIDKVENRRSRFSSDSLGSSGISAVKVGGESSVSTLKTQRHRLQRSPGEAGNESLSDKRQKRDMFEFTADFFSENSRIINLYASPQTLKTHLVYLISGKLGEMFLFQKKSQLREVQTCNAFLRSFGLAKGISWSATGKNPSYLKLQNQLSGGYSSVGLSNTWQAVSTLVLSYIHKRYLYHKNLIVPKQLNFTNYSSLLEYPSPPATNILLPAKRYENYKRSFTYFASKRQTSIRIMDQINLHQQQRLVKRLYRYPVQELFRSEIMAAGGEGENRFTTFTNASLMIGSYDGIAQKTSSSNWFMKNRIFMRHKNYLTNQWWNGQLPEHNNETTFLSDIDWRYTFISSSGEKGRTSVKFVNLKRIDEVNSLFDSLDTGLKKKDKSLNTFELGKIGSDSGSTSTQSVESDRSRSDPKDILLDFPDADQHYNPRNRRWLITKGAYNNWFDFEKTIYSEIYSHFIFDSFIKAYSTFEQNRDILDFYAFYLLKNPSALIRTDRSVKLYERMFKTSNRDPKGNFVCSLPS
uniref:Cell division protein n=1 Tax=Chlamydomonas applanata TaxID=35704 RepID=A0A0S2LP89_CHLAP|nr:cell division protein [Chlamydomonas applanata]